MNVAEWLRSLGLGQYETLFRENEIDPEVLPELTEIDLEKFGVPFGHRKRLLRAIAGLGVPTSQTRLPAPTILASPNDDAERRQLTVMFCDLVGSTELSARLDPEDVRAIIGVYRRCCASLIAAHEGFVAKYMGDGVLAYFGYPRSHEHDAERAVLTGLAIVEAVPKLETSAEATLRVRVGIATGIVVVGDLLGSGEAQERGVVGDTPNLAARLLGIAEPGGVVIAEGTRKLLGSLFELVDLGPQELKGVAAPARAFAALRESAQASRFEALRGGGQLTALVGREEESELLSRRWAKAKAGDGQAVLLLGEAGIGKSRLAAAFLKRLAGEPHVRRRYFCSPLHTNTPLHPIIGHLQRAAGLSREDDAKAKLDKLDALLAGSATSRDDAALVAEMLSLPNDGRHRVSDLAPQERREKTIEALIRNIETISGQSPALMVFEDAHWADPSSLEVLGRLVEKINALPVLLLVTSRPEFAASWVGRPHVKMLTINRLAPREVTLLIERVAGGRPLAENVRRRILERSDGIPLFVEEMTKSVLEAEDEGAAKPRPASSASSALSVPASLHASLMARLDRLGSAKSVAQIGAAIGREFSHALLAPVTGLAEPELKAALDRLIQSGLLSRRADPPDVTYLFKHALVQDAAYGSLLREPTRALHARIAEVLELNFPEIAESQPELLARHCTKAGLVEKAARFWGMAGRRSLARSALVEAVAQLSRTLEQIATLPGTSTLRSEQIELHVALINALFHVKGYAAPETQAAVDRASELIRQATAEGEPPEDPLLLLSVLFAAGTANFVVFNGDILRQQSVEFMALSERVGTATSLMLGHRGVGTMSTWTGDFVEGRRRLDRAIKFYDPAAHRSLSTRFGHDVRVAILCHRSLALWALGYPEAALSDANQALAEAREIAQAATMMNALCYTSFTYSFCGDYVAATSGIERLTALADEKGATYWKTVGLMGQGHILALTGHPWEAVNMIATGMSASRSTGSKLFVPTFLSHLAMAHLKLRQFGEARLYIDEAMTTVAATKERLWEAEIHRVAGRIAQAEGNHERAEIYMTGALAIARKQEARSWELRAALTLARLRRDQGRRGEARDLLAPVYGWFTEGFDTLDLRKAKALLDELA
jgi:class 3 adenylate cyclase/tetratricopeptide (TPR) repeat protein